MSANRYAAVGLAVVLVAMTVVIFSDGSMQERPDYTGIVSGVREGDSGFTFELVTYDGSFRCFHSERPSELGYYGVTGSFSDDGNIFFVETLRSLERRPYMACLRWG